MIQQSLVSVGCPVQAAIKIAESAPKDSVREYVMSELTHLGYTEQANRYRSYWGGFSSKVLHILKERYLMRNTETPYEMFGRMADCMARGDDRQKLYHEIMWDGRFLPNSPCFMLDMPDDLPGIMDTVKDAALILQSGGDVSIDYSALRTDGSAQLKKSVSNILQLRDGHHNMIRKTNPCWGGETKVLTRSGPVSFRELAMGPSQVEVLSREEDGTLSYRTMQNPGITTQNAEVVALVLESETGECSALRCTPSHNVYVVHGTELQKTEVQNLTPGMSLHSVYNDDNTTHQTLGVSATTGDIPVKKMDGTGHPTPGILPLNLAARKGRAKKVRGRSEGFMTHEGGTPVPGNSNKTTLLQRLFGRNHKVLGVIRLGRTDVYNGIVDTTHNYFVQCGETDYILSGNCGEHTPNQGAINLSLYVTEHNTIDWEMLDVDIGRCTRMLDTGTSNCIGLGVMGVADMLLQLGIPYNSAKAYKLFGCIAEHLSFYSMQESVCMAREHKPSPLFKGSLPFAGPDVPYHPWEHKAVLPWDDLRLHGMRHTLTTAIVPTETISMIAGCSPGIDPVAADMDHPIHWADHIMALAAWQRWIGSPINRIITVQDLRAAHTLAHRLGCWGIIIHKDDIKMPPPSDVVAPYL